MQLCDDPMTLGERAGWLTIEIQRVQVPPATCITSVVFDGDIGYYFCEVIKVDKKKLRFAILKEIDNGNASPDMYEEMEVDYKLWLEQVNFLVREGYMNKPKYSSNKVYSFAFTRLTEKGEKYLEDNNKWRLAYKAIKEVRDWIK